ncbi:hypothetical protein V1514DRAFT_292862 [Lipomyces japonicus]|uniref:uncharacterized protein n=1 Tax=Lipomyces japonicus TaxID=56871 RepID=UPI0034CD9053
MELSELVAGSNENRRTYYPIVSYSGKYIATLTKVGGGSGGDGDGQGHKIVIRSSRSLVVKKQILLPVSFMPKFIKWYVPANGQLILDQENEVHRIFAADDQGQIRVWDMADEQTSLNAIDDLKSVVVIRQVSWGANVPVKSIEWGRSPDEIVVFSEYHVAVAIWSLINRDSVEIISPKFTTFNGFSFQPKTRHFSILSRPISEDILTIYGGSHSSLTILSQIWLSNFYDVKGFKWSLDGKWIAVYDNVTNYQVGIFSALGELFRMFSINDIILGVCNIAWSSQGLLAIASYDGIVRCLAPLTFTPTLILNHTATVDIDVVYVEQPISGPNYTKYERVRSLPVSPPKIKTTPVDAPPKTGVGILEFNHNGTFLATRYDATPTTLWIWSLKTEPVPVAVLVHVRRVRMVEWHPLNPNLLLITTADSKTSDDSYVNYDMAEVGDANDCCVRVWNIGWRAPVLFNVPKVGNVFSSVTSSNWINTPISEYNIENNQGDSDESNTSDLSIRKRILICNKAAFTIGYLDDENEVEDDETKVQRLIDGVQQQEWAEVTTQSYVDDTFALLRQKPGVVS